ncbi:hypothetical protein SSX86_008114 [Deinandra increscens subsp. villosa]|uniref:Uncharacterized protein n=1 Tax=Deinandra increscens subsp. villosa TaxID=3103831 RepID=A0AAP0H6I7_9ASTR
MSTGDRIFQGVYGGCISIEDVMGGQQRPYHCNCSCALHKSASGGGHCSHVSAKVSYPIRRSWSTDSMLVLKSGASPVSSHRT